MNLVGPGSGCDIHLAAVVVMVVCRGCHRHLTASRKSIPAKVLKSERSLLHIMRNFQVNEVGPGSGCDIHLAAVVVVCCAVDATGTSQLPEKSIPAKVLKSERSLAHILRNFQVNEVGPGSGCDIHLADMTRLAGEWMPPASPSPQKKYTGNSFKFGKVRGGFENFQVCFGWSGKWMSHPLG